MDYAAFVKPEHRALFDEHQRFNRHFKLKDDLTRLIKELCDKPLFADRMARQSLIALGEQ